MSKNCKCSGIGAATNALDFETMMIVGTGGVLAMAMTNPLANAIYKNAAVPNWFSPVTKTVLGYSAIKYANIPVIQLMGIGCIVAGVIEGVKAFAPDVFGLQTSAGKSGKSNLASEPLLDANGNLKGVGSDGFNVINLNDPEWQRINAIAYAGEDAVEGTGDDDCVL